MVRGLAYHASECLHTHIHLSNLQYVRKPKRSVAR